MLAPNKWQPFALQSMWVLETYMLHMSEEDQQLPFNAGHLILKKKKYQGFLQVVEQYLQSLVHVFKEEHVNALMYICVRCVACSLLVLNLSCCGFESF